MKKLNTCLNCIFTLMGSLIFSFIISLGENGKAWNTVFHHKFKGKMDDLTNVKTWFSEVQGTSFLYQLRDQLKQSLQREPPAQPGCPTGGQVLASLKVFLFNTE